MILKDEPDIVHRQVCLQSAQIPYSFYVINFTNNILKIGNGTIYTYTIPVGNYNATNLITKILELIATNFPAMSVSLDKLTGKIIFTNTTAFTIYNNFIHSIGTNLGMVAQTTLASVANIVVMPFPLNLLGIKNLEIRSATFSCSNMSSQVGGMTTLLATIPVSAVPFGMIDYKDTGNNQMTFSNTSMNDIDIDIIDAETGEYVNFNNCNWCLTFIIHLTRTLAISQRTNFLVGKPMVPPTTPSLAIENKPPQPTLEKPPQPTLENSDLQDLNLLLK
jgi:hypothetical protein